jgi:hypothetical protein
VTWGAPRGLTPSRTLTGNFPLWTLPRSPEISGQAVLAQILLRTQWCVAHISAGGPARSAAHAAGRQVLAQLLMAAPVFALAANLSRRGGPRKHEDFDVFDGERDVGRMGQSSTPIHNLTGRLTFGVANLCATDANVLVCSMINAACLFA